MLLPNADQAVVALEKVTEYLLSHTHPTGKHKARFFVAIGFSPDIPSALQEALLNHARTHPVWNEEATPFGIKYIVEGALAAPNGSTPSVRVVWILESGSHAPRLVTAFPAG